MEISGDENLTIFVLLILLCKGQPLSVNSVLNKQESETTSMSFKIPRELSAGTITTINGKPKTYSTNGAQNEVANGTSINGQLLGSMTHRENEMAFRLPRPLQSKDVIEIKGEMKSNPERICIGLTTGQYNIDYNNIVCEVEARFLDGDNIVIRTRVNGQTDEHILERERPSDLLPVAEFTFAFKLVQDYSDRIEIAIDQSYLAEVDLKHNFQDISYVTLSHDILKVNELSFKFNNTVIT